ncbi:MAG: NAD(+) synthase [Tannerellaceae bacterium]
MNHGFIRVAAAIPKVMVADCASNSEQIEQLMRKACKEGVEIICFPELSITGYTCGDLFHQQILIEEAESTLAALLRQTAGLATAAIIGMPLVVEGKLFNTAVAFQQGAILGVVPKSYLPNYSEFQEKRWFVPAQEARVDTITLCGQTVPFGTDLLFKDANRKADTCFGIEICEDLWVPNQPSSRLAMQGAHVLFNPSACNERMGVANYVKQLVIGQSARCFAGYIYTSAGYGESTTDVVFAGNAFIAEAGTLLAESKRYDMEGQLLISDIDLDALRSDRLRCSSFTEGVSNSTPRMILFHTGEATPSPLLRPLTNNPMVPEEDGRAALMEEAFHIQALGLAKRMSHAHAQTLLIGISGGLDSTLALLVAVKACDLLGLPHTTVIGITMPGFGTTDRTYNNALALMTSLGITQREIPIREACEEHFRNIGHDRQKHDITYENAQARERTQILMDVANQQNGLVVGTGDLSELALGWATYNGDHMSMYGVNAGLPKTLIRHIVRWVADIQSSEVVTLTLRDILDTPISPELLPAAADGTIAQKTEDQVGPYELHDFFLYYLLRYGFRPRKIYFLAQQAFAGTYTDETLKKWLRTFLRRFFTQQFKRSCMPDGPKVMAFSLSPRGDWRMPSDASSALWLSEAEAL